MEDIKRIKEVAIEAAREAGVYMLEHMGKLKEIEYKGGINNLVTDVDKASERIIIDKIRSNFPEHAILAEESGEQQSGGRIKWVIDPLDGTTNYAHAFPIFCVSIGIAIDGDMSVGVVYDPTRDEIFHAVKDEGSFLNGNKISVSSTEAVQNSLLATGFPYNVDGKLVNMEYFKRMIGKSQAVRRAGSAAIDLCYVACGRFDGYWELYLQPWDTAAGTLIVSEAGGKITKIDGAEYNIYDKEIMATNGKIHLEMRQILIGTI